jgi:hypothetical protein
LPHPDHPGYTHAQWFIRQHGHVHIMPVAQKAEMEKRIALREFSSAVVTFGKAAAEFAKVPPMTADDYFATAATMENGGAMYIAKIDSYLATLLDALRLLEPYADRCTKPASSTDEQAATEMPQ